MYDYTASDPRDQISFVLHATPARRLTLALVRVVFTPLMLLDVYGLEHVPEHGQFVLTSNHINNWDVFAMQLAMPRTIFFMGKAELFRFTPLGAVLRNFGAFPVYRGERDAWALRHARRVLDAGQVLGMFPEGHRSRGRGLLPARTGAARLAIETHTPILPMAIDGTQRFLRSFPLRTHVHVSFLPPIHARPDETPEALTERLMRSLAAALPESIRGGYGDRSGEIR